MYSDYVGPMMKKISEEMERKANEKVKKYRLTLTQGKIILFLSERLDKRATQKELEEFLQVSHPTTVTIVKSMEAKGMIKTFPDDEDRRMKIIKLIWGNEEIYQELRENARDVELTLMDGFSDEEKQLFLYFLNRAYNNAIT